MIIMIYNRGKTANLYICEAVTGECWHCFNDKRLNHIDHNNLMLASLK